MTDRTELHYHTKLCNAHRGAQYPCDCSYPSKIKAQDRKQGILYEMRDWILHEYSLPIMEAHHDGHPVESCARQIYDKICTAIEEIENAH